MAQPHVITPMAQLPQTPDRPGLDRQTTTRSMSSWKSKDRPKTAGSPTSDARKSALLTGLTKANPNAAINELQPIDAAALEESTLGFLSSVQHVDGEGNVISEPDLSNPTRSRWERPLDTIRSFENQIDNAYRRRSIVSTVGGPNTPGPQSGFVSRRNSYFAPEQNYHQQQRYQHNGGYHGRPRDHYAPRDQYGPRGQDHYYSRRESYLQQERTGYDAGPAPPRHRMARGMASDPALNRHSPNNQHAYPQNDPQRSRETFGTGESSGSASEPWAYSTDPSSENSSVDRFGQAAAKYQENGDPNMPINYGSAIPEDRPVDREESHPYGQPPPRLPVGGTNYYNVGRKPVNVDSGPAPPPKSGYSQRPVQQPVLSMSSGNAGPPPSNTNKLQRGQSQKRMSWLKKRFSKTS